MTKNYYIAIIGLILLILLVIGYKMTNQNQNQKTESQPAETQTAESEFYQKLKIVAEKGGMEITEEAVKKLEQAIENNFPTDESRAEIQDKIIKQAEDPSYYGVSSINTTCPNCQGRMVVIGYSSFRDTGEIYSLYCLKCGKSFDYYLKSQTFEELETPSFGMGVE